MRALSLWQPWASLIAYGAKKIETRSWRTRYRGRLAIASTARWNPEVLAFLTSSREVSALMMREALVSAGYMPLCELPLGCVVCTVELRDVVPAHTIVHDLEPEELAFGDFSAGGYAWLLGNPKVIDPPIPVKGSQGLWDWPVGEEPE